MSSSLSKIGRTSQEVGVEFKKLSHRILVMVEDLNWQASSSLESYMKKNISSGRPDNFCKTFYNSLNLFEPPIVEMRSVLNLELDSKPRLSAPASSGKNSKNTVFLVSEGYSFVSNPFESNIEDGSNFPSIVNNDVYMRSAYSTNSLGKYN